MTFKKNIESISIETWIKIIGGFVAVVGFAYTVHAKVLEVESKQESHIEQYEQFRFKEVPRTYMRKDVAEQVIIRLERIETKIDKMNNQ